MPNEGMIDPETGAVTGGISENVQYDPNLTQAGGVEWDAKNWEYVTEKKGFLSSVNQGIHNLLFFPEIMYLNWSREYLWYVELDGVPNPFQRGGVVGLPCKSVQFTLAQGKTYSWEAGINSLSAPQSIGATSQIQLEVFDDEQGTIRGFFERWYNQVYNPYEGVLPLAEACKGISIYLQKTTRSNVTRYYKDYNQAVQETISGNTSNSKPSFKDRIKTFFKGSTTDGKLKSSNSINFLVYPTSTFQFSLDSGANGIVSFSITLEVAAFLNQDFSNPDNPESKFSILGMEFGNVGNDGFLHRLSNFI